MDKTAEIVYGVTGQTIATYPPEWALGVPSSATAAVYGGTSSNDDAAEFSPTVTVDSVSTTVDAASGYAQANRRKLSLTSTVGIAADAYYRIENAAGQCELVRPVGIVTNDYVTLDADLAYDYAVGATCKGLKMSVTVDPTWVATEANICGPSTPAYRVVWTYTVASVARKHYGYARLVRQAFGHGVTVNDLKRCAPDLMLDEPQSVRGQSYAWAIDEAANRLRADLLTAGWKPEQPRDSEIVNQLVLRGALFVAMRHRQFAGEDVGALVESLKKDYDDLFAASLRAALRIDVDQGTEGASASEPAGQLWFKR